MSFKSKPEFVILLAAGAGLVLGLFRAVISRYRSATEYFTATGAGLITAVLAALAMQDSGLGDGIRGFLIGAAALIGEDCVLGLILIGAKFRVDPLGAVRRLLEIWRNKP